MQPSRLIKAAEAAWPSTRGERRAALERLIARADLGIVEWKLFLEYQSDEHHGPRFWIADGQRMDLVEAQTGWRLVEVDRFDLRPSNTNLRDRLERLRPVESGPAAA